MSNRRAIRSLRSSTTSLIRRRGGCAYSLDREVDALFRDRPLPLSDVMPKRQVIIFKIDGASYSIEVEHAAELADRLHNRCGGDISQPAYAAAVLIDQAIDGDQPETPEWHTAEKGQLAWAIHVWINEAGFANVPEPVQDLRYALFGEDQDALPAGDYNFILSHEGGGETDAVRYLDTGPTPGQAVTIDGRTFIVRAVTKAPGSAFVAMVTAEQHPG
jgi:hypothetical protein